MKIVCVLDYHLKLVSVAVPKVTSFIFHKGISKVNTSHAPTYSGHEEKEMQKVFSCSATGKPAPTIEWDFSPGADTINTSQTTTVKNSDNTFTSSSITTLKIPADWSGHVDCVLNRGMEGERRERIPFTLCKLCMACSLM